MPLIQRRFDFLPTCIVCETSSLRSNFAQRIQVGRNDFPLRSNTPDQSTTYRVNPVTTEEMKNKTWQKIYNFGHFC